MRTTRINTLTQVFTSVSSVNSVVKHVFPGSQLHVLHGETVFVFHLRPSALSADHSGDIRESLSTKCFKFYKVFKQHSGSRRRGRHPLCRTVPSLRDYFSHEDTKAQRKHYFRFKSGSILTRDSWILTSLFPHFGQPLCRRCHQSRAVLPKPPHEPVSAKLAYLKPPLRHFGQSLSITSFSFHKHSDTLDSRWA